MANQNGFQLTIRQCTFEWVTWEYQLQFKMCRSFMPGNLEDYKSNIENSYNKWVRFGKKLLFLS